MLVLIFSWGGACPQTPSLACFAGSAFILSVTFSGSLTRGVLVMSMPSLTKTG